MGSSAVAVREESRRSAQFDRYPTRGFSGLNEGAADRCDEVAGNAPLLSANSPAQEMQTTTQIVPDEVDLHAVWFALSQQQRLQFGGHFSEMLLRAVRQQNKLTSTE
jgi:hypothetical protein